VPLLAVAVLGAVAALATMGMTSGVQGDVGPGSVSIDARLARDGVTGVALPPFGVVSAATHGAPLGLELRVDAVDVDAIQMTFSRPRPQAAMESAVRADLGPLLRAFARRATVAGMLVGGVVGVLVPGRRWPHAVVGAAGGAVGVAALLGFTWLRYDVDAFEEATFQGALERAPSILATVQAQIGGLDALGDRVRVVSQQVAGLYAASELGAEPAGGETLILHVSDIHSNPLGVELTKRLAESFAVDAVLDTGDLTSFGLPVESRIIDLIDHIGVPYVFVPGNHDSTANREALDAAPAITLLSDTMVEVRGVRILGVADPSYTADNRMTTAQANQLKLNRAGRVRRLVREVQPDLLAVHDLRQAADIRGGDVATVVAGHSHERSEENRDGTLLLTVGSTGATGLGTFLVESAEGYEAQILRYTGRRLTAIDYVTLSGVSGSFEVDRRVVTRADRERDPRNRRVEGLAPSSFGSDLLSPFERTPATTGRGASASPTGDGSAPTLEMGAGGALTLEEDP
jgi:predicted phosphodiesterase